MDSSASAEPITEVHTVINKADPPINRLTIEELAKIFSYLEPLKRLSMARVCRKWARASGLLWTDITVLDVAPVPEENIGSLVRLCPNLKSIVAALQTVHLTDLNASLHGCLSRLALLRVDLAIQEANTDLFDRSLLALFRRMPKLEELVWHDVFAASSGGCRITIVRGFTPPISECGSLAKLHLTGGLLINALQLFDSLRRLPNLRCLTLGHGLCIRESFAEILDGFRQALRAMSALRELCLINIRLCHSVEGVSDEFGPAILLDCFDLLQLLEVFVFVESPTRWNYPILLEVSRWIELHPSLRLLVVDVTGSGQHHLDNAVYNGTDMPPVPPRRRFPKGFGSDPLPFLNVLLGGMASNLPFSQSTNAKFWPISERLPDFLLKPEIADITGGVWALDVIKDAAKRIVDFWRYNKAHRDTVHFVN